MMVQNRPAHRAGFTMVELLFVLLIVAILVGLAAPQLMGAVARSRVDNAAAVLASDLHRAFSVAARQGTPVRIQYTADDRTYRLTDRASGTVVLSRRLGDEAEFSLSGISFSKPVVDVFPRRIVSSPLRVTLSAGGATARVQLMAGGLIRVESP